MIRLSVKGLAKYMTSSPAAQRRVLRDFKYPREDQPFAMRLYYADACDRIEAHHRNGHDAVWLQAKARELGELVSLNGGASGARLRHNARALRHYADHFAVRTFEVLPDLRLRLDRNGVRVSCVPDLHVRERGKEKIVKFDFGSSAPSEDLVRIVSQCMFEAASGKVNDLSGSSVLYLDVSRGVEHRGARARARMLSEIDAACETISAVWDTIQPPR